MNPTLLPAFSMNKPLVVRALLAAACLALLPACGSDKEQANGMSTPRSADLMRALDCGAGAALTQDAAGGELRHLPADDIVVSVAGQDKSFCDLLRDAGKPLAVLQFASVKCHKCLSWIEDVNAGLGAYADAVLPVAVVIDDATLLSDGEMAAVQADVAASATWARDTSGQVWDFFAPVDRAQDSVPLTVVMDRAARAFFTVDATLSAETLVQMANQQMSAGL